MTGPDAVSSCALLPVTSHQMTYQAGKLRREVTSGWQWLTSSKGSDFVRNTRNDDVVYVHMTDGKVYCVENNSHRSFINDEPQRFVDGIRISSNPNC